MAKRACLGLGLLLVCGCAGDLPPLVVPPPTVARPEEGVGLAAASRGTWMSTRKQDLVEKLHGTSVADPYRWLEDSESEEVKQWTAAQNAHTRALVDAVAGREAFKADIQRFLQVGYVSSPSVRRTREGTLRYFHSKREGTQNQSTLYVRDGLQGRDRALIDVSSLSQDGTSALDWWYPSRDGKYLAWGRSESGSEESVLYVRDVVTGKDLPDRIDRTRHASVAWLPDNKGFYYSRYPEKGTVPPGDEKYGSKIFFHELGKDPATDRLIFGDRPDKTDVPTVTISPNGKWLVVRVHQGWGKSELYLREAAKDGAFLPLAVGKKAIYDGIARDDMLYVMTNDGAPRYRLYAVDYAHPERAAWKEVLSEEADTLDDVAITKDEIVAAYMVDAATKLVRFGRDGKKKGEIPLPSLGQADVSASLDGDQVFVHFESYGRPSQISLLEAGKNKESRLLPWDAVGGHFSADDVTVTRLFATSRDGTKIPLLVVSRGALQRTGLNPTVLYGYGGFNVNQKPAYSARVMSVLSRGGVWAHAILRGGGEYGEAWHEAGMLGNKQNVFDDFYACAEKLASEKITSSSRLAAMGGSNGGLLVATAVTQRPELFRVGLSLVPLTDMLRYHLFRIGKLWIPEYGDPGDPKAFSWLSAYSPYHHVKEGTRYPSMFFTTAESDSRVDPMHARKIAARMQAAQADASRPVLLRVETKAGHGAGKPVSKLSDEMADELTFLFHELGVNL